MRIDKLHTLIKFIIRYNYLHQVLLENHSLHAKYISKIFPCAKGENCVEKIWSESQSPVSEVLPFLGESKIHYSEFSLEWNNLMLSLHGWVRYFLLLMAGVLSYNHQVYLSQIVTSKQLLHNIKNKKDMVVTFIEIYRLCLLIAVSSWTRFFLFFRRRLSPRWRFFLRFLGWRWWLMGFFRFIRASSLVFYRFYWYTLLIVGWLCGCLLFISKYKGRIWLIQV